MPGNENFDRKEIVMAQQEATIGRMAWYGGTVPAVQDIVVLLKNAYHQ
jgi:hypothetical protein